MAEKTLQRVIIVEDQTILRDTLAVALRMDDNFDVIGDFNSAEEALQFARGTPIDFAIVDNILPGMNGIDLIKELKALNKATKVLIISAHPDAELILRAFETGAEGFLPKNVSLEELLGSLRDVVKGDTVISQKIAKNFLKYVATLRTVPQEAADSEITTQHIKLLQCASQGLSNKEIAARLSLKETHVKALFNRIYKLLDATDRAQAVFKAIKAGYIRIEDGK